MIYMTKQNERKQEKSYFLSKKKKKTIFIYVFLFLSLWFDNYKRMWTDVFVGNTQEVSIEFQNS